MPALSRCLSYHEFEQALQLFASWWQCTYPDQPGWTMQTVMLPVVEQVVHFAQLERVVLIGSKQQQERLPIGTAMGAVNDSRHAAAAAAAGSASGAAVSLTAASTQTSAAQQACDSPPLSTQGASAAAQAVSSLLGALHNTSPYIEQDDAAAAVQQLWCSHMQHIHQYSIAYHETYQVPVLYIKVTQTDGSLLRVSELLQDLPWLQQYRDPEAATWTFLTATEHPLLRVPCFMLHPCQTAARMALMMPQPVGEWQQCSSIPAAAPTAEKAAEPTKAKAGGSVHAEPGSLDESASVLLTYMKGWFSLVAGLLGFSMAAGKFITLVVDSRNL